jgi:hypothetical protein
VEVFSFLIQGFYKASTWLIRSSGLLRSVCVGSCLATCRDRLSVPASRVKQSRRMPETGGSVVIWEMCGHWFVFREY